MINIKEERLKAGLTQMELAKIVGVSLTTIRTWEAGIGEPNEENKEKLLQALGIKNRG